MEQAKLERLINNLPAQTIREMIMISAISPFNQGGGRLSRKGAEYLAEILRTKMTQMEMVVMTDTNPAVLDASNCLIDLYKVCLGIIEILGSLEPKPEELAKLDDEFFKVIGKVPVIKEILIYMANDLKNF